MPNKEIQPGQEYSEKACERLTMIDVIVKSDLGIGQVFLAVAAVVQQVFEIALVFGYIHHNRSFVQLTDGFGLLLVDLYSGIKQPQKQAGESADVIRQQIGIVIMRTVQNSADPSGPLRAGICRW